MHQTIEILIFGILALYVLFELIRINVFKKDSGALFAGLASMLLLGFGIYLYIKYGLIIDYWTQEEITNSNAEEMLSLTLIGVVFSLVFILTSILKFIVMKLKKLTTKA